MKLKYFITNLLVVLSLFCAQNSWAQTIKVEDDIYHWEGSAMFGLNTDGLEWDFDIAYFFNRFIGAKAAIGMVGEIAPIGTDAEDYAEDYNARLRFLFSAVLRTPKIINWVNQGIDIYLFAEPGISLSPALSKTINPKICNWNIRTGLNLQIDRWIFTLGYGLTDFNLYSGLRDKLNNPVEYSTHLTHTVYVSCAYKF